MKRSIVVFRVVFVLSFCISRCASQYTRLQGHLPNISLDNIIDYVKPYIQSLKIGPETVLKKSFDQTKHPQNVMEAIDAKIIELEKLFQDDDVHIDKDTKIKNDEETTTIEFVPKTHSRLKKVLEQESESVTKTDIRKYKNMRNKIKLALQKENISPKTKKMVTKTLDDLIAKLLSSKCGWDQPKDTVMRTYLDSILVNSQMNCYLNNKKLNDEECKELLKNITTHTLNATKIRDEFKTFYDNALNQSSSFLQDVFKKIENLRRDSPPAVSDRYKLRCEVVDTEKIKSSGLRRKSNCEDFRVCSEEFRNFLAGFYNSLNDTTVNAFKNYAAMYVRDVNTDDSEEKNAVSATINNVSGIVEGRVRNVFIKKMSKIKLAENKNADTNIEAIKEYIKTTVRHIIKKIKKHLEVDLQNLRARILLAVKEDIIMNLDVDLGNLETNYLGKICMLFVTCKGELSGSLRKGYGSANNNNKQNSVYVKVQLSLDNQIKDSLARNGLQIFTDKNSGNVINAENPNVNLATGEFRATRTTLNTLPTSTTVDSKATTVKDSSDSENSVE